MAKSEVKKTAKDDKPKPLEKQIERLEKIVEDLETGEASLEQSIGLYEEGTGLGRECLEKLEGLEQRVRLIRESADGSIEQTPFEEDQSS